MDDVLLLEDEFLAGGGEGAGGGWAISDGLLVGHLGGHARLALFDGVLPD